MANKTSYRRHSLDDGTLAIIDSDLRKHREHLKLDNTYDDSLNNTPRLSPVSESVSSLSPTLERGPPDFLAQSHRRTTSSSSFSSTNGTSVTSGADVTTSSGRDSSRVRRQASSSLASVLSDNKGPSTSSSSSVSTLIDETTTTTKHKKKAHVQNRYRYRNLSQQAQVSILESNASKSSSFFGFFTLFWVTVAFLIIRGSIYNYVQRSEFLGNNIPNILRRDLIKIALTDLMLYSMTYFTFFWQLGIKNGYLEWNRYGWIVEHVWQIGYLAFVLWFNDYMHFPWIGCVFLLLHSLVFVMKMHSYAFYNGHFWGIKEELETTQKALVNLLEQSHHKPLSTESIKDYDKEASKTRTTKEHDSDSDEPSEDLIESLMEKIDFCTEEIKMQSEEIVFPANITLKNYFDYSSFPTLVYQIDYPRTEKIRWDYVLMKTLATFGVFLLMIIVAENYLYPIAMRAIALRERSLTEKLLSYPMILLDLVPPFILMYLLVFYIIWDVILNGIAELTRFGDRQFYGEWWNCVTWDQFAKDWNTPVHRFLLRHVYHSSISSFHISKQTATCK